MMAHPWRRSYRPKRHTKKQLENAHDYAKNAMESLKYMKERFANESPLPNGERRSDAEEAEGSKPGECEDRGIHKDGPEAGRNSGDEASR
jgi:hypothetical protein